MNAPALILGFNFFFYIFDSLDLYVCQDFLIRYKWSMT